MYLLVFKKMLIPRNLFTLSFYMLVFYACESTRNLYSSRLKAKMSFESPFGKFMPWGKPSSVIEKISVAPAANLTNTVLTYFDSWNERNMVKAISLFVEDCEYEDTLYPDVFKGRAALERHLYNVAAALPSSFEFIIDAISTDNERNTVGVQWHLESEGKLLPFTRGSSMYILNDDGMIVKGFDVPEPVVKSGSVSLQILKTAKNIIQEPQRGIAVFVWLFYIWYVFLSDIAPGPNALSLDPATWKEVFGLSFNYMLVSPIILPSIAPSVHPMLESLFNFVLLYATLFIGFIVDGKPQNNPILMTSSGSSSSNSSSSNTVTSTELNKENKSIDNSVQNNMLFTLIGMQALTNAFLLPYLITRPSYTPLSTPITTTDLSPIEKIGESKLLPSIITALSFVCIYWIFQGRIEEYGTFPERYDSFKTLVSQDRLTFSFVIDMIYFSIFQGWLIDDDYLKRQISDTNNVGNTVIKTIGKYIPFYGVIVYLFLRPPLPSGSESKASNTVKQSE